MMQGVDNWTERQNRDKARWLDGKVNFGMENAAIAGQHHKLYQVVKEVTGKKSEG